MHLDIRDIVGRSLCITHNLFEESFLSKCVRGRYGRRVAGMVSPRTSNHCQNVIVMSYGILKPFEHHCTSEITAAVAVSIVAERLAVARVGQHTGVAETGERVGPTQDVGGA